MNSSASVLLHAGSCGKKGEAPMKRIKEEADCKRSNSWTQARLAVGRCKEGPEWSWNHPLSTVLL
jgi:hypothetical protein